MIIDILLGFLTTAISIVFLLMCATAIVFLVSLTIKIGGIIKCDLKKMRSERRKEHG